MGMKSGKLDRRVVLMRPTTTSNGFGEPVEEFVDAARVWASIARPNPGGEVFQADQNSNEQPTTFEIRFRDDLQISAKWRLQYRGRTYDIVNVEEIGRRDGLRLTTTARDVIPGTLSHALDKR